MDGKTFARLGAVVFIGVAITATAIETSRKDETQMEQPAERILTRPADPLRAELIRCQLLGEGGSRDAACLRAWAENRRRFLAPGARPMERLPEASALQPAPDQER
ncbi:conjugal transfer protein TrbK [Xaviernesmea oryzae]|uniref:Conjugal transfer protein TrbK n=1 Tax=Xaviernesmea oryzae TaxID=464029 RepID=A0A1Q9ATZ6_9HYPH|nr:putative entry exclusion protein TrbK-alt [Xaviernesmea oryzae]OLP58899.1 conjugal transfer protein TrbK [Xaviernesmea oryzae]SEM02459.1 conjugative transfer region protein TrbK [Xaviernesmea oryzae]